MIDNSSKTMTVKFQADDLSMSDRIEIMKLINDALKEQGIVVTDISFNVNIPATRELLDSLSR